MPRRWLACGLVAPVLFAAGAGLAGVPATAPQASAPRPVDRFPRAAASYVVVLDGRVLWERSPDTPRPQASLVKIMTGLVLLDGEWDANAVVAVSARAARQTGSQLGLEVGEEMNAGELLTALLVISANDAAVALAEHAAGSVERFVERMNAKAKALGLSATHFVNPTGLDAEGQASSANDVAKLADTALGHAEFARLVALQSTRVETLGGRRFELETSNALLGRLPGAKGAKTGFTSAAGKCVVALAERGGHRVLAVLLDAPDRWWAADGMIREAFDVASAPE